MPESHHPRQTTPLPVDETLVRESLLAATTLEPLRRDDEIPAPLPEYIPTEYSEKERAELRSFSRQHEKKEKGKRGRPATVSGPVRPLNPAQAQLAKKIAKRTARSLSIPRLQHQAEKEARAAVHEPFDPAKPVTAAERSLERVAENVELSRDLSSWQEKLDDEAMRSIDVIVELRDNSFSDGIRLKAATDILDRGGKTRAKGAGGAPAPKSYDKLTTEELVRELAALEAGEAEITRTVVRVNKRRSDTVEGEFVESGAAGPGGQGDAVPAEGGSGGGSRQ